MSSMSLDYIFPSYTDTWDVAKEKGEQQPSSYLAFMLMIN